MALKKRIFNYIQIFFFSFIYLACLFSVGLIGRGVIKLPDYINPMTISGSINAIALGMALLIVIISNGRFFALSLILQHLSLISVIASMVSTKSLEAFPGLIIIAVGLLISLRFQIYIKKLKLDEKLLDQITYIEPLTNTLNRRGLRNEIEIKINLGKPFFLAKFDIDNFKQVNESLGSAMCDNILKDLTEQWLNIKNNKFLLSRSGGDDFTFIFESLIVSELESFLKDVYAILNKVSEKYNIDLSMTGGITQFPNDALSVEQLLVFAEVTMKKAKKLRLNQYLYFELDNTEKIINQTLNEDDIQKALYDNRFELRFQPQFDIDTQQLLGAETLLRLKDLNGNYYNTQELIELAEQSNLIYEIDKWVIRHALISSKDIVNKHKNFEVSVNVSGKHIIKSEFLNYIIECLDKENFNPTNLKLEITESSYIKDIKEATNNVNKLKSLGIKIALDDFGTGYSSLSYLSRIPVDLLKIDKSFVDSMEFVDTKVNFIKVIIKLGHLMSCKVIAEGVENEEQLKILKELGCDYIQGYIWGKPLPLEQFLEL